MRCARLSTAGRGSMLALALALAALPAALLRGQAPAAEIRHPGGILVQATDTSINPLAVEIVLPAFGLGVRLSDEGVALFLNIPDGVYLVQARHLGYRPEWRVIRITGDTARVDVVLPPADPARGVMAGGLAASRLREFLRRSGSMQMASFITRSEIERRRPRNLIALLSRVPDVTIDRRGTGSAVVRSDRAAQPACASGMLLFVDGMLPSPPVDTRLTDTAAPRRSLRNLRPERARLNVSAGHGGDVSRWATAATARELARADARARSGRTSTPPAASALDWVPISLVAGVEVYPRVADAPPELRVAGAECGVLLVWTTRS